MSFEIGLYTVIILVGPSQSGKSTWAQQFKNKITAKDSQLRTTVLSSDAIRRQLLDNDYHRYDRKMTEASEAAFDLLFASLKAAIRFPINNEFVIVDTTGLDPEFRRQVTDLAKENGYRTAVVMFDYATSDYFTGLTSVDKTIVSKHVDTFKKRTLPGIKKKHFTYNYTVKSKDKKYYDDLHVEVVDYAIWRKSNLSEGNFDISRPIAVIGDIHENVQALKLLYEKLPENAQVIFVGDLIDKGEKTEEMITYAEQLIAQGALVVRGNHEAFVARRLLGEIEAISNEDELFSSYKVLKEDEQLAKRFLTIYENTIPFACVKTKANTIYVTHAPCYNKSLGKLDERSQKFQRNFYFASRENDTMMEELSFVAEEAKNSHPYHVFGHVANSMKNIEYKNKVWLDTGAVYGNKLSAFILFPNGDTKVVSQAAEKLTEGKLLYPSKGKKIIPELTPTVIEQEPEKSVVTQILEKQEDLKDYIDSLAIKHKLSPEDKYWLHSFNESGAKFISGTMSPSRSTQELLEPIKTAIEYFRSKGVDKVIMQPKYMGSRLQLYLHRDKSLDFAVTRSGTKSGNKKEIDIVLEYWHSVLDEKDFWKDTLVLDGELLPWAAIGKDLIAKEFTQYGKSIESELSMLVEDPVFNNFSKIIGLDAIEHKKALDIFMAQTVLYGSEQPTHYKPFTILSVDGKNWCGENQLSVFTQLLPEDPYMVIDVVNDDVIKAESFFNSLTVAPSGQFAFEGVVIKPLVYKEGVAPYMKVRNENYLHLIYGYDYQFDYAKMVANKRIGRKLDMSVKEYEIGMRMLNATTKVELLDLACQMKFQINDESKLDSRL